MNTRRRFVQVLLAGAATMALACSGSTDPQAERQFWADRQNQQEHENFVLASAYFFLLHEVAHAWSEEQERRVAAIP